MELDNDETMNSKKKKMKYSQKYCKKWEKDPAFKEWLKPSAKGPNFAFCIFCDTHLSVCSGKQELKKHGQGKKHAKNGVGLMENCSQMKVEALSVEEEELSYDGEVGSGNETDTDSDAQLSGYRTEHDLPHSQMEKSPQRLTTTCDHSEMDCSHVKRSRSPLVKITTCKERCNNFTDYESNMSRRVPLNCRDPFFRDLDRDFFGESNRQNWSESTPTKLFDQHFATGLWPDEVPTGTSSMYIRSRRTPREKSGFSIINSPKDKFTVLLEVPHFLPDELKVRVTGSVLEVEGKHGERQDDHGAISRQFNRKYNLPEDVMVDYISSSLSAEGVLTIEAPKKPLEPTRPAEREVPIQKMGPAK